MCLVWYLIDQIYLQFSKVTSKFLLCAWQWERRTVFKRADARIETDFLVNCGPQPSLVVCSKPHFLGS